jgi:sensor histidine kinase YesM
MSNYINSEIFNLLSSPIIIVLVGALITFRFAHYKRNKDSFDQEFNELLVVFTGFTQKLWDKEKHLDSILVEHFKAQENAVNIFIHNLTGKRRIRFYEKWDRYQQIIKTSYSFSKISDIATVIPAEINVNKFTLYDLKVIDYEKRKEIHGLLDKLIESANKPIWK